MGMRKKFLCLALLLCLALPLCGCRTRTRGQGEAPVVAASGQVEQERPGDAPSAASVATAARDTEARDPLDGGEPGGPTKENPDARRKEYDENAPAQIVPGTDHLLHSPGEGNGAPSPHEEAETAVPQLSDRAQEPATQTVPASSARQRGVSQEADAADSAFDYYTVLLQARMGALFECQRLNVYWETSQDHVTIHKSSPEHALILNAGCYDVSSRLLPENLRVDDGWVARKNPGVIVKIVDGSVLGGGAGGGRAAKAVYESLKSRDGWAAIDAVKNKRVLLLSEELLEAPFLQTAAMVMIAKTANPDLFADTDPDHMLELLMEEATGALPTGIYYYKED